jgi:hypothetical protein
MAFDLIDYIMLMDKSDSYNFPDHFTVWPFNFFLHNGSQFVKLGEHISGAATITLELLRALFLAQMILKCMLIKDLQFPTAYMKSVDDTTVYSFLFILAITIRYS